MSIVHAVLSTMFAAALVVPACSSGRTNSSEPLRPLDTTDDENTESPTEQPSSSAEHEPDLIAACGEPCGAGKLRRGVLRCVTNDGSRPVIGVVNCPSIERVEDHGDPAVCEAVIAETRCIVAGVCESFEGTCCTEDFALARPTGPLGNSTCGSPGEICSGCRCLPGDALVATPGGPVAIRELREGDSIWTQTLTGERIAAPIVGTARVEAPPGHRVLELVLADGRRVRASPTHPAANGTALAELQPGDVLDGARVAAIELVEDEVAVTHDVLPAGGTGLYWVDGVLLRTTFPLE